MKKTLRIVLLVGLALLALTAVSVAILFVPAVQKQIALAVLGGQVSDPKLEHVSLGLSSAEIRGLSLVKDGVRVELAQASATYALSDALFDRHIRVDSLAVKGVRVDARNPQPKKEPADKDEKDKEETPKTKEKTDLPRLTLKDVRLEDVEVLLPQDRKVRLGLIAKGIATGSTGKAALDLTFTDLRDDAPASSIDVRGDLDLRLSAKTLPETLRLDLIAGAKGGKLQTPASARLVADLAELPNGSQRFTLKLSESQNPATPLIAASGTRNAVSGALDGDWSIAIPENALRPLLQATNLPSFRAIGKGTYALDPARKTWNGDGTFNLGISELSRVDARLKPLDGTWVRTGATIAGEEKRIRVDALISEIGRQDGSVMASLGALQPFTVLLADGKPPQFATTGELLRIALRGVPTSLATPFLPADAKFTTQPLTGTLVLASDGKTWTLTAQEPVSLRGMNLDLAGKPTLRATDLLIAPAVSYDGTTLAAEVRKLTLASENQPLVDAQFRATSAPTENGKPAKTTAQGKLTLNLDRLVRQPVGQPLLGKIPNGATPLSAEFGVEHSGDALRVRDLKADLSGPGAPGMLALNLAKPLDLNLKNTDAFTPPAGEFLTLSARAFPLALLAPFIPGYAVSGDGFNADLSVSGEADAFVLRSRAPLALNHLNVRTDKPLIQDLSFSFKPEARITRQRVDVALADLSVTALGADLAKGSLNAAATLKPAVSLDHANLDLSADVSQLLRQPIAYTGPKAEADALRSKLPPGPMPLTAQLRAERDGKLLRVRELKADLSGNGAPRMLAVALVKPLEIDVESKGPFTPPSGEFLKLNIRDLPLTILAPFIPGYAIKGDALNAELSIAGAGDTFVVSSGAPVSLQHLSVSTPEKPLIEDLTVAFTPNARASAKRMDFSLADLSLSARGASLAQGSVSGAATLKPAFALDRASLELAADLAQLLRQPAAASLNNLQSGTLRLKANAEPAAGGAVAATLDLPDLRLREPAQTLAVQAEVTGTAKMGEKLSLKVPVRVKGPTGESALSVTLDQSPFKEGQPYKLALNAQTLFVNDLMLAAQAFKNPAAQPAQPQPQQPAQQKAPQRKAPVVADKEPFWKGLTAQATVDIKKVLYQRYTVTDIAAQASATADALNLSSFTARVNDAPLAVNGRLDFKPVAVPYTLKAAVNLAEFEVSRFLAENPAKAPLDGRFAMRGQAEGSGLTLPDLLEKLQGDFKLQGGPGHLRALVAAEDKPTAALGLGGLQIAGGLLGGKVRELGGISRVIGFFRDVPYTSISLEAERGRNLDVNLSKLLVDSPDMRLSGTGKIAHNPNQPIREQPLNIEAHLAARNDLARALSELKLLTGQKNAEGFYPGPDFKVTGSLANFSSNIQDILLNAALRGVSGGNVEVTDGNQTQGQPQPQGQTQPAQPQAPAQPNQQQQAQPQPPPQQPEKNPAQAVQDILKLLGK